MIHKKLTHLFVLSCKRATFLIEKQLHHPLSPLDKLQLRAHLSLCAYCVDYKQKAVLLDRLMRDQEVPCAHDNAFCEQELAALKEQFKSALKQTSQ